MPCPPPACGPALQRIVVRDRPVTPDLRQEPGAGKPPAGICAGGRVQSLSLPRPSDSGLFNGLPEVQVQKIPPVLAWPPSGPRRLEPPSGGVASSARPSPARPSAPSPCGVRRRASRLRRRRPHYEFLFCSQSIFFCARLRSGSYRLTKTAKRLSRHTKGRRIACARHIGTSAVSPDHRYAWERKPMLSEERRITSGQRRCGRVRLQVRGEPLRWPATAPAASA